MSVRISEARQWLSAKKQIDDIFPNVDKSTPFAAPSTSSENDVCSICLLTFHQVAKVLPCQHHIHASCLRQLMRRAERYARMRPAANGNPAEVYVIKCPL